MPKTSNNKLIPQLVVSDARKAIDFYTKVFGAKVDEIKNDKHGVIYAKLLIGNDAIIIVDKKIYAGKTSDINSFASMYLYDDNPKNIFSKAMENGAQIMASPMLDNLSGDKTTMFWDPFGLKWSIADPNVPFNSQGGSNGNSNNKYYKYKYLKYKTKFRDLNNQLKKIEKQNI